MQTKEEKKAYRAAYRAANREKLRAQNAAYRAANLEKVKAGQAEYRAANAEKIRASNAVYRANNREKIKVASQVYQAANPRTADKSRKYNYGMVEKEYDNLVEKQGGVCAICKGICSMRGKLSVDHSHSTGKVRGLLCAACNAGLGHFKDSALFLRAAADYLEKS